MLIRFEVENFRSIRESAELSMVAVDEDRAEARRHERIRASLVPAAGIFGPNASGKSNMLSALMWLRNAVADSLRGWEESIPVEPFAFGEAASEDMSFILDMEIDGVRYEYLLDIGAQRVSYEALFHYPEGRQRRVFERDGEQLEIQRGLGRLSGARALLTERTLALSAMRKFDVYEVSAFVDAVVGIQVLGKPLRGSTNFGYRATLRLFAAGQQEQPALFEVESHSTREEALAMLKLADLGITDVEIDEVSRGTRDSTSSNWTRKEPMLVHESKGERKTFDYRNESIGTRAWFELIGPVLAALKNGRIALFDEIDASLHPVLTSQLVRMFESTSSNPRGAQLIFTTHDTNLLNDLNRDEIWLTEKNADGETSFAALAEYSGARVRRTSNVEAQYLSGRFGALPDVSQPAVLRALGLIA
ncbi:ATP/GTP-binding protein [Micrococcus antarcticus]|uniref:AAA family ATPase n=1 Tax=Glutamicibacter sp. 2E12 TaxID=3416181 RepID=UPI00362DC50D